MTQDLQVENPSWGSSLAEQAAAGISLRSGCTCAALIHPLLQPAEMACGLAVIAQCAAVPP